MDNISSERLLTVHPVLAERVRQLAEILATQGVQIRVTQALRTWKEQEALYAQGRTIPGAVVTHAPAGSSWHNFGLAVDVAPFSDVGIPDWNVQHPDWKRIVFAAPTVGLKSGSTFRTFPDWPHLQPDELTDSPSDDDRADFLSGGIIALWEKYPLKAAT